MKNHTPKILLLLALAAGAHTASAQVRGALRVEGQPAHEGVIRWKSAEKQYEITTANATMSFPFARVQLNIPRPQQLDTATADLRAGRNQAVITALNPLLPNYIMLVHDEEIASVLAQAHTAAGNPAEAQKACERVIAAKPEAAYKGRMAAAYWAALLAQNRSAQLENLLEQAVKTGDIPAMCQALVMRGDIHLKAASPSAMDYKNALVNGYLRVIVLYGRDAKNVLPEALYKAAQCLDKLHQTARAQKFRERLREEFPDSEWASMQ